MRDAMLLLAGLLAILVGIAHGVLGETHLFPRATIEPRRVRLMLRAVWQCSAAAWIGGGVLLIAARSIPDEAARRWIVGCCIAIYVAGLVGNALASRGRHVGWMLLAGVVALALAGF